VGFTLDSAFWPIINPLNVTVDWGDGTTEVITVAGTYTHTVGTIVGNAIVNISGTCTTFEVYGGSAQLSAIASWDNTLGLEYVLISDFSFGSPAFASVPSNLPSTLKQVKFYQCYAFNGSGLVGWDTSNLIDMEYMFYQCNAFNQNIGAWNTANVTKMNNMFDSCAVFNQYIGAWVTTSVTNMSAMFSGASVFNQDISGWDMANVTTIAYMFYACPYFNQPIGAWTLSSLTSMVGVFEIAMLFNQDISTWNISGVTSLENVFNAALAFNQPLSGWNVSHITSFFATFNTAFAFNQDISGWDTSSATDMGGMFVSALAFNQDISGWNTSLVTNFGSMFGGTSVFNQNISIWDTSSAVAMNRMFENAVAFNQPIGVWDTHNCNDMIYMFNGATAFSQDLTPWNVALIPTYPTDFATGSGITDTQRPIWGSAGISVTYFAPTFISGPDDVVSPAAPATVTLAGGTITYADNAVITPFGPAGTATSIGWDVGGTLSPKLSVNDAAYTGKTVTLSVRATPLSPSSGVLTGTVCPFLIYVSAGVTYGFSTNSVSGTLRTQWYQKTGATVTSGNIGFPGGINTYALVWNSAGTSLDWVLNGTVVRTLATARVAGRPFVQIVYPTGGNRGVTSMRFTQLLLTAV
jgi:surface protein